MAKELAFLRNHTGVAAVFALDMLINENDKIIGKTDIPQELKNKNVCDFNEIYRYLLKYGNSFLRTPTFMARRDVFENVGVFNEKDFGTSADLEMWLRILEKYPIGILDEKLMKHRICGSSGAVAYHNKRTETSDFFVVMEHFLKSPALTIRIDKEIWKKYRYYKELDNVFLARNLLRNGEICRAKSLLGASVSLNFIMNSFGNLKSVKNLITAVLLLIGVHIGLGSFLANVLTMAKKLKYRVLSK